MPSKCKCGDTESYNFALNIGLCNPCIGERIVELERKNHCAYSEGRNKGFEDGKRNADNLEKRIKKLEADVCPSWMGKEKGCNESRDVEKLEAEKENLKSLLEQLIFIAEKSTTDDAEDTTIELAAQALNS